jgi:diguanylate cyclase (GGDEF)-like protein
MRWVGAALGATILLLIAGNFGASHNPLINLVGPSPLAIVLFLFAAVALLERPAPEVRNATRFLSVTLAAAACVWILRDASVWGALGGSNDRDRADFVIAMFVLAQILVAIAATLCLFWIEVRKMEGVLEHMAFNDPLTELPNRRSALLRFREEVARAVRHQVPFALLVMDVDHFKQVNDRHGHQVGDEVLKHVARLLAAEKRVEDMLARIGGEEFACLLSHSDRSEAELVANRMRELVAQTPLTAGGEVLRVTVSGGLALYPQDGESWDAVFAAADRRLYDAKAAGRDRVSA